MFVITLNIIGLALNFGGALMMFLANTKIEHNVAMFPNEEDLLKMNKNKVRTRQFRLGMGVLSLGFFVQLSAMIIPLF